MKDFKRQEYFLLIKCSEFPRSIKDSKLLKEILIPKAQK